MVQINIDGKPINFTGPKPETAGELIDILGMDLYNKGRVVHTILVDGENASLDEDILARTDYHEVSLCTINFNESTVVEINHLLNHREHVINLINALSHDLVNDEWEINAHKLDRLNNVTVTIVTILSRTCDSIKDNTSELFKQAESLLNSFKIGINLDTFDLYFNESLYLSDTVVDQLVPAVKDALDLIQGPVKGYFDLLTGAGPQDFPA